MNIQDDEFFQILRQKGYKFVKEIGKGGTSTCFLVESSKYDDFFVCKVCRRCCNFLTESNIELNVLMEIDFNGIIRLYDYHITDDRLFLFLEYCSKGSLLDFVHENGKLEGDTLADVCKQILKAVEYIHGMNTAHLDIKPANILINKYGRIKLADFGYCKKFCGCEINTNDNDNCNNSLKNDDDNMLQPKPRKHFKRMNGAQRQSLQSFDSRKVHYEVGTTQYKAPEIMLPSPFNPFKADIWSLGATFYFIATGENLFDGKTVPEIENSIKFGEIKYNKSVPSALYKIIKSMCNLDPQKRPSCTEILENTYFNSNLKLHEKLPVSTMSQQIFKLSTMKKIPNGSNLSLLHSNIHKNRRSLQRNYTFLDS